MRTLPKNSLEFLACAPYIFVTVNRKSLRKNNYTPRGSLSLHAMHKTRGRPLELLESANCPDLINPPSFSPINFHHSPHPLSPQLAMACSGSNGQYSGFNARDTAVKVITCKGMQETYMYQSRS